MKIYADTFWDATMHKSLNSIIWMVNELEDKKKLRIIKVLQNLNFLFRKFEDTQFADKSIFQITYKALLDHSVLQIDRLYWLYDDKLVTHMKSYIKWKYKNIYKD